MNDQPDKRQLQILEMVREAGEASIEQLAAHFDLTQQTIRRVVNPMCERGLLRRVHGGVSVPAASQQNLAYQNRQVLQSDAKRRIARAVASFIPDGASVMIGLGTTPEYVAHALAERSNLRVITNSLNAAMASARNPEIEITIAGGTLRQRDRDIVGSKAFEFFSQFKADFGIFGVGGIDDDGGLLDFYQEEVQARQAIMANSRTTILVADVTKFGRNATTRGGYLDDCAHIFLDETPPVKFQPLMRRYESRMLIAQLRAA